MICILSEIRAESLLTGELGRVLMMYGRILWLNGKQWEAEKQYLEARDIFVSLTGEESEQTAISLYNLAYAQVQLGKLTHAFRSADAAQLICLDLFGDEDDKSINALVLHAHICERLGRFNDAKKSYKQSLEVSRKHVGQGRWSLEAVGPLKEATGRLFILESARKEAHSERQKKFENVMTKRVPKPLWTPEEYLATEEERRLKKESENLRRQSEVESILIQKEVAIDGAKERMLEHKKAVEETEKAEREAHRRPGRSIREQARMDAEEKAKEEVAGEGEEKEVEKKVEKDKAESKKDAQAPVKQDAQAPVNGVKKVQGSPPKVPPLALPGKKSVIARPIY